jgi:hypothetical protein
MSQKEGKKMKHIKIIKFASGSVMVLVLATTGQFAANRKGEF